MRKNCCSVCGRLLTRNEIGLTRKLIDDSTKDFYCLSCMAEFLEVAEEDLLAKIEDFRQEGCKLFS